MNRYFLVFALCISLLICSSCSKNNSEPLKKPEHSGVKIGVQLTLVDKDVAKTLKKELEKKADTKKIQLLWKEPTSKFLEFEKNIEDFKKEKVNAIIVQFLPGDLTFELFKKLSENNIKVIAIGTLPLDISVDGYLSPDNYRLGQLQGQYVLDSFKEKNIVNGRVILYEMDQSEYSFSRMTAGLLSILNPSTGVTVETREIPIIALKNATSRVREELLKETKVDAVVVQGSSLAVEAVQTLKNNSNTQETLTVGVGVSKEAVSLIAEGKHNAEADLIPEMLAQSSLEAAVDLIKTDTWKYDTHIANGSYDIPAMALPVRLIKMENIFLLKDRYGNMPKGKGDNSKESSTQGGSSDGGSKQGDSSGGNFKLKIKTKDGQTLDMDLPGEIEEIEVKKSSDKGG